MVEGGNFNAARWLVDRHVEAGAGERVALVCAGATLTYRELQEQTWRAAALLRSLGVGVGERVLMVLSDEPAFPALFLGAMRLGAVAVPVSTMLTAADLAELAADAGAVAVAVSEPYAAHLPTLVARAATLRSAVVVDTGLHGPTPPPPTLGAVGVHRWSEAAVPAEGGPDAPCRWDTPGFWLYTSGTTGLPKAAVHRHGDIEAVCATYAASVLDVGPEDLCYSVPKLFFAFGLGNALLFPLAAGARALLDPAPPTPARVASLAREHRPTLFFAPPGFCAALADAEVPDDAFASARATVTAGETLPPEVYRRFRARFGVEMLDGLGSTEALHIFCSNHPGDVRPGSTGRPVAGYELRLLAEDGSEIVEADRPGALWVRGRSVTPGYWQRPEVNATTFVDGWCRTGDVYRRDRDGYYYFVGRNSDMIKAGGIWVSPVEVEAVLLEHPGVREAAVVGGRSAEGLERTVAFVVAASGRSVEPAELIAHCRSRMAAFKRPSEVHVLDELPRTATGKVRRYALRDALAASPGGR